MKKTDVYTYPRYELKEGFTFSTYKEGMEDDWCRIQVKAGMVATWNEAKNIFKLKFMPYPELLSKYCVFILNSDNLSVAVAAFWPGNHFGKEYMRIHWLAVDPDYQDMGLGKALITRLMNMYEPNKHGEWLYLTSQSWNYCAINLYYYFGFRAYVEEKPINWYSDNFDISNKQGWELINKYIDNYKYNILNTICLGDYYFQILTDDNELLCRLKKIFPMVSRNVDGCDGILSFIPSSKQEITFDKNQMNVMLNKKNMNDKKILRDVVWFIYHMQAAQEGCLLIGKTHCEIIIQREEARVVFLRKRKYREFDSYKESNGLEWYWEIFHYEGNYYIRDIQFRNCYRIKGLEWHILKQEQQMTKKKISWQSFQNRMCSMAEEVIASRIPLQNKVDYVFHLPYVDNEDKQCRRRSLIKQLYTYTNPIEVIGDSYWRDENG